MLSNDLQMPQTLHFRGWLLGTFFPLKALAAKFAERHDSTTAKELNFQADDDHPVSISFWYGASGALESGNERKVVDVRIRFGGYSYSSS